MKPSTVRRRVSPGCAPEGCGLRERRHGQRLAVQGGRLPVPHGEEVPMLSDTRGTGRRGLAGALAREPQQFATVGAVMRLDGDSHREPEVCKATVGKQSVLCPLGAAKLLAATFWQRVVTPGGRAAVETLRNLSRRGCLAVMSCNSLGSMGLRVG